MMRLCRSPNQQNTNLLLTQNSFQKGVHIKKEDMRILFSTLLESSKVKTSKSTQQRTKKCLGRYTSIAIETALNQFHQDKMCTLKAKDGNRESKQKKSATYLSKTVSETSKFQKFRLPQLWLKIFISFQLYK